MLISVMLQSKGDLLQAKEENYTVITGKR